MRLKTICLLLGLAALLAACSSGPDPKPPDDNGEFELTAVASCEGEQALVELSWTASFDGSTYTVLRDGSSIGEAADLSYTDTGTLAAGSEVTYQVRADLGDRQALTDTVNVTVPDCDSTDPDPDPEPGPSGPVSVALGVSHTLVVQPDGTVLSWGTNRNGSLGRSVPEGDIALPGEIEGLEGIIQVAAGTHWSLALSQDGVVWSWGDNEYGQLGDGTKVMTLEPQQLEALAGVEVQAIVAGTSSGYALTEDGQVYAWGRNNRGQLGLGAASAEPTLTPTLIDGLTGVTQLVAGNEFAIALLADGTLVGWGTNDSGQQAQSPQAIRTIAEPTALSGVLPVKQLAAGTGHLIALTTDDRVYAWGQNSSGQLGIESEDWTVFTPTEVDLPPGIQSVFAGTTRSFASNGAGDWWAWGTNGSGQLGTGDSIDRNAPAPMAGKHDFADVDSSTQSSVAIQSDGTVFVWGGNLSGQAGLPQAGSVPEPASVPELTDVVQVASGDSHTLAVTADGSLYSWGENDHGQLGHGDRIARITPTQVEGISNAIFVAAGDGHSVVIRADGSVMVFGRNTGLDDEDPSTDRLTPEAVSDPVNAVSVTARDGHALALTGGGQVWGWGRNLTYQLGLPDTAGKPVPAHSHTVTGATQIATGSSHTLLLNAGTVSAWGSGAAGQLGNGESESNTHSVTPVAVLNVTGASQIAAAADASFAVAGGALWVWGLNDSGVLGEGNGSHYELATPRIQEDSPLQNVIAVAAGSNHALALQQDGKVFAWGNNTDGQVGNGVSDGVAVVTPQEVFTGATAIFTGSSSSFALLEDGSLMAWGDNYDGMLGIGTSGTYRVPVQLDR